MAKDTSTNAFVQITNHKIKEKVQQCQQRDANSAFNEEVNSNQRENPLGNALGFQGSSGAGAASVPEAGKGSGKQIQKSSSTNNYFYC